MSCALATGRTPNITMLGVRPRLRQSDIDLISFCDILLQLHYIVSTRGVVLKKKWGTPETRLTQRFFKQFRPTYTYTHTRQKNSDVLKLSYTAFQQVTSCNSGLTFARISVQKSERSGGRVPPVEKSGDAVPARPRPTTPLVPALGGILEWRDSSVCLSHGAAT